MDNQIGLCGGQSGKIFLFSDQSYALYDFLKNIPPYQLNFLTK